MPEVLLLGSGGHAKVIIEIFRESGEWNVIGCISPDGQGGGACGVPVLGDERELPELFQGGVAYAFAAIGDNRIRSFACARLREIGFRLPNAVSRWATLSPSVRLDDGVAVMAGAVINAETFVGAGVIVNTGATIDHDCELGAYSHVAPGCNLAGGVKVGAGVFLGIGSCVIPRVGIGAWSTVGAGGVVISDLPAGVTAIGAPARVRKTAP